MKKDQENKATTSCYKKQIIMWFAFVMPIVLMLGGLLYLGFSAHKELKDAINTAEKDIKAQVSSDDLRASTNKIISKTDEVISLVTLMKDEMDKSIKIDEEKNKLMSNKYHMVLLASLIEKSILKGESFADDLETLKKFADKKISKEVSILSSYGVPKSSKIPAEYLDEAKYPNGPPSHAMRGNADNPDVKAPLDLIALSLADSINDKQKKNDEEQGWMSRMHKFFAKWFSIEKVDGQVDSKDKHGYASIALEMLKDKNIDGAYFMLLKLSSNKNFKAVLDDLKQLKDAMGACKSIKDKVLLDD